MLLPLHRVPYRLPRLVELATGSWLLVVLVVVAVAQRRLGQLVGYDGSSQLRV